MLIRQHSLAHDGNVITEQGSTQQGPQTMQQDAGMEMVVLASQEQNSVAPEKFNVLPGTQRSGSVSDATVVCVGLEGP